MTAPQFADPMDAHAYAEYVRAQREEYSTWQAAMNINMGAVLAFTAGQPVPKSTVEREGWDRTGEVVRQGTPAPQDGVDRAAQLRERREQILREQEAIEVELATVEEEADVDPYAVLTVEQLRNRLGDRGLSTTGRKDELLARLHEDDDKAEPEE